MIRLISLLLLCATVFSQSNVQSINQSIKHPHRTHPDYPIDESMPHHYVKTLHQMAVGSCSNQHRVQPLWEPILNQSINQSISPPINQSKPDIFVWLGDIVYADYALPFLPLVRWAADSAYIKQQFDVQRARKDYQKVINSTALVGIWDDHDLGENDGNIHTPYKDETQAELLDFFDETADDVRRHRKGVYTSFTFGPVNQRVKLILLDSRYYQDIDKGQMLGEEQWKWLEHEILSNQSTNQSINEGTAPGEPQLIIIGSSIQLVTHTRPVGEGWRHFPADRTRLFRLLSNINTPVLFLSGDVHYAEAERSDWLTEKDNGIVQIRPLIDVTTSGMTHSAGRMPFSDLTVPIFLGKPNDRNQHTAESKGFDHVCTGFNAALLDFDWQGDKLENVRVRIIGVGGVECMNVVLPIDLLKPVELKASEIEWPEFNNKSLGSSSPELKHMLHRCQYEKYMASQGRPFFISGIKAALSGIAVVLIGIVGVVTLCLRGRRRAQPAAMTQKKTQ